MSELQDWFDRPETQEWIENTPAALYAQGYQAGEKKGYHQGRRDAAKAIEAYIARMKFDFRGHNLPLYVETAIDTYRKAARLAEGEDA